MNQSSTGNFYLFPKDTKAGSCTWYSFRQHNTLSWESNPGLPMAPPRRRDRSCILFIIAPTWLELRASPDVSPHQTPESLFAMGPGRFRGRLFSGLSLFPVGTPLLARGSLAARKGNTRALVACWGKRRLGRGKVWLLAGLLADRSGTFFSPARSNGLCSQRRFSRAA